MVPHKSLVRGRDLGWVPFREFRPDVTGAAASDPAVWSVVVVNVTELVEELLQLVERLRRGTRREPLLLSLMEAFDLPTRLWVMRSRMKRADPQREQVPFEHDRPGAGDGAKRGTVIGEQFGWSP
jgi:hypothetical protein